MTVNATFSPKYDTAKGLPEGLRKFKFEGSITGDATAGYIAGYCQFKVTATSKNLYVAVYDTTMTINHATAQLPYLNAIGGDWAATTPGRVMELPGTDMGSFQVHRLNNQRPWYLGQTEPAQNGEIQIYAPTNLDTVTYTFEISGLISDEHFAPPRWISV